MSFGANIATCHRCPSRASGCRGPCNCTVDQVDIIEHAKTGCPLGYYEGAPMPARTLPDGGHWGAALWGRMHGRPLAYAGDTYAELAFLYGDVPAAFGCDGCLPEWSALLSEFPPDLSSDEAYARWLHAAHDRVNVRLGRTRFAWAEAVKRLSYPAEWLRPA